MGKEILSGNPTERTDGDALRILHITYRMHRAGEEEGTNVDLPISAKRYAELAHGGHSSKRTWQDITDTLKRLTRLQGFDRLGAWDIDLEIIFNI
jgi:hypothetical protein